MSMRKDATYGYLFFANKANNFYVWQPPVEIDRLKPSRNYLSYGRLNIDNFLRVKTSY